MFYAFSQQPLYDFNSIYYLPAIRIDLNNLAFLAGILFIGGVAYPRIGNPGHALPPAPQLVILITTHNHYFSPL
jgi:hypothetical protein